MEQNHLCNFDRGHHGKYSYEGIVNLDHAVVQEEMVFKESLPTHDGCQRRPITLSLSLGELIKGCIFKGMTLL